MLKHMIPKRTQKGSPEIAQKIGHKQGDTTYERKKTRPREDNQRLTSRKKTESVRGGWLLVRRGPTGRDIHTETCRQTYHRPRARTEPGPHPTGKDSAPFPGSRTGSQERRSSVSKKQSHPARGCGQQGAAGGDTGWKRLPGVGARKEGTWQKRAHDRELGKSSVPEICLA